MAISGSLTVNPYMHIFFKCSNRFIVSAKTIKLPKFNLEKIQFFLNLEYSLTYLVNIHSFQVLNLTVFRPALLI